MSDRHGSAGKGVAPPAAAVEFTGDRVEFTGMSDRLGDRVEFTGMSDRLGDRVEFK